MATVLSDLITNRDATPPVRNSDNEGGYLIGAVAYATISATITSADIVHMIPVPSHAKVFDVQLSAADATTALAADVGLYLKNADGTYTAVDVDFFATAYDFTNGPIWNFSVVNESATNTPAKQTQPLWQSAAGLSADPQRDYFVSLTITTTGNGGPTTVGMKVTYVE
jgi:hypothetical protein